MAACRSGHLAVHLNVNNSIRYYTVSPPKPGTHIMANNFHKHPPISMPFDRIVLATLLDDLP